MSPFITLPLQLSPPEQAHSGRVSLLSFAHWWVSICVLLLPTGGIPTCMCTLLCHQYLDHTIIWELRECMTLFGGEIMGRMLLKVPVWSNAVHDRTKRLGRLGVGRVCVSLWMFYLCWQLTVCLKTLFPNGGLESTSHDVHSWQPFAEETPHSKWFAFIFYLFYMDYFWKFNWQGWRWSDGTCSEELSITRRVVCCILMVVYIKYR